MDRIRAHNVTGSIESDQPKTKLMTTVARKKCETDLPHFNKKMSEVADAYWSYIKQKL